MYGTNNTTLAKPAYVGDSMERLLKERKVAREYQERRHADWNETYEMARGKVRTNRLTQRQAVNIPLMKETEKTLLSKIDDPPNIDWSERASDEQKEIIVQAIWDDQFKKQKFEWKDTLDKKNVLRYGVSTKKLNISKTGITVDVLDVFDVVYDPMMSAMDIESARFVIHQNIFKSVREILADDRYTKDGKDKLKQYLNSKDAIVQSNLNKEELQKKQERMHAMGVSDAEFGTFSAGDVIVNLCEHYTKEWDVKEKKFIRKVYVYADDCVELLNEKLEDLIGVDFYPFVMWAEDPETNDIYADSIDDLIRVPNKILNVFFSQMIENRTLRNFQMHWYDATKSNYTPQVYEPGPGRMLPAPGNPKEVIMPVEISGLEDTLTSMQFLISMTERATGATAIEKGVGEQASQTLGEVEILVGKAMERTLAMAKFYRGSWYELANKWMALMLANAPKIIKLYKPGRSGTLYPKTVYPSDWVSEFGYEPTVSSTSEQEQNNIKSIQKFQFVTAQFPDNLPLKKIAQKRELELLDLSPEELREVEEFEEKKAELALMMPPGAPGGIPVGPTEEQTMTQSIEQGLGQLATL